MCAGRWQTDIMCAAGTREEHLKAALQTERSWWVWWGLSLYWAMNLGISLSHVIKNNKSTKCTKEGTLLPSLGSIEQEREVCHRDRGFSPDYPLLCRAFCRDGLLEKYTLSWSIYYIISCYSLAETPQTFTTCNYSTPCPAGTDFLPHIGSNLIIYI